MRYLKRNASALFVAASLFAYLIPAGSALEQNVKSWSITMFGQPPAHGHDMQHWPYVDLDSRPGGEVTLGKYGSFDNLNRYILRGVLERNTGLALDTLLMVSGDDLLSAYGLLAELVEFPPDRSWVTFHLHPQARWHDGVPITAHDFKFAFEVIRDSDNPFLRSFYRDVSAVEVLGDHQLHFKLQTRHQMKPIFALGRLSPEPRHWWAERDIKRSTLEPLLTSGPYRIVEVSPGRSITYERVADYWGGDLPVRRGTHNFDRVRFDYYRDASVMFQAFLSGHIDFQVELQAKRWHTGYHKENLEAHNITRRRVPYQAPRGAYGLFMNMRRPIFQELRVRQALNLLFDYEMLQSSIFFGEYTRSDSWFPNSEYGVSGMPTPEELDVLEPHREQLMPEVVSQAFTQPRYDDLRAGRGHKRQALQLLREAGWHIQAGRLVHRDSAQPFPVLELLIPASRAPGFLRVLNPYVRKLKQAGIESSVRSIDTASYEARTDDYDYDMIITALNFFPPPGAELRSYFHSQAAAVPGQGNLSGIQHPIVDALLEEIEQARDLLTIVNTTRALDRVLLWQHAIIHFWYDDNLRIAYRNRFRYPARAARYTNDGGFLATWWDPTR